MEVTEKEVALLAEWLRILFDDVADQFGVYNQRLETTWMGPPPIKDKE